MAATHILIIERDDRTMNRHIKKIQEKGKIFWGLAYNYDNTGCIEIDDFLTFLILGQLSGMLAIYLWRYGFVVMLIIDFLIWYNMTSLNLIKYE